ncbi:glycosyltransferase family 2 protein [Halopseudomonas salegens]|uniref:Glycosyl transferase family 2 n=1 Tax=Halopseudomonas salegens TaxID=1434072 RepID=A0A1H2EGP8_9GAMM|nr:glycosyltransferase [Halopseudomonas salegens]SDT94163.1 Glycosyl transferase family 2 [Halopseudomonas salegens]
MNKDARVVVITPTIGTPELRQAVASVQAQTAPVRHLVVVDGDKFLPAVQQVLADLPAPELMVLPENTGANGFNGHRVYASVPHLVNADYVLFLDEDNWFEPEHVASLLELALQDELDFAYALRKVVSKTGEYLCHDDCESLGKWPAFHGRTHLVDTSCYLFRRQWLIKHCHLWHTDNWHVDRNFFSHSSQLPNVRFACSGHYSLNYRLGSTERSVKQDFFQRGNALMAQKYAGKFPWSQRGSADVATDVVPAEAPRPVYRLEDLILFAGVKQDAYRPDAALLSKADRQTFAVLPPAISEQLQQLQRLLPLEQHQQMLRQLYGRSAIDLKTLIPDLRRAGLVTSGNDLYDKVLSETPTRAGHGAEWVLGIASADRPAMVERLLQSLLPYVSDVTPSPLLVFVDDSRQADHAQRNEAALRAFAADSGLQLVYHNRATRARLVKTLAGRQPELSASLHWLLDPVAHPEDSGTYGLGKNLLSLYASGKKLLMLDDDCLLPPWQGDEVKPGASLSFQTSDFAIYDSFDAAMADARPAGVNPLQAHLDVLGQPLGQVFRQRNAQPEEIALWQGLSAEQIPHLSSAAPVSMTTNTIIGAQNSRRMDMLFTLGQSGERVERYLQGAVGQTEKPQISWRMSERDCIHPQIALLCTTLSGVAVTELPAPCIPVGRSEDLFLGELTRYLTFSAQHYRFAWGLVHQPQPERSWNPWAVQSGGPLDTVFLHRALLRLCESECHLQSPEQRYAYLLTRLQELLLDPDAWMFAEGVRFRTQRCKSLRQNLQDSAHLPHYQAALKRQLADADKALAEVKSELAALRFSWQSEGLALLNALRDWPGIVALCRSQQELLAGLGDES